MKDILSTHFTATGTFTEEHEHFDNENIKENDL